MNISDYTMTRLYKQGYVKATLKEYPAGYKLIALKTNHQKGKKQKSEDTEKIFDGKEKNNITRAKQKIYDLAMANDWGYWVTLTLDPNKIDRSDLKLFNTKLAQWFRDMQKKHNYKAKYLLVPELHLDGLNWHMHGFFTEVPEELLRQFDKSEKIPQHMRDYIEKGKVLFDFPEYREKFGFISMDKIDNKKAVAAYITKYIKKDMERCVKEKGAHLYYASQGLNLPVVREFVCSIAKFDYNTNKFDFENDYVIIKHISDKTDLMAFLKRVDAMEIKDRTDKIDENWNNARTRARDEILEPG